MATTVGRPRPGFELRLVREDGTDVETGASGEVVLRGGSVMAGYLDDPEETQKVLSADALDALLGLVPPGVRTSS